MRPEAHAYNQAPNRLGGAMVREPAVPLDEQVLQGEGDRPGAGVNVQLAEDVLDMRLTRCGSR